MAHNELVFAALGGIGEIGMNLSIYGFGDDRRRQWIIVDCGVSFASEEHLPGVDLILPDIRYLIGERRNILALVLTHGHEDHMGALIDLWPRLKVPIHATPFTAALFEARRASEPGAPEIPVHVVPMGGHLSIGPFAIDFINVAHSIPESNALAIRTPAGTVLHTGDWKIDPTPLLGRPTDADKLSALGDKGVLALVGDSTNAIRDGRSPSESDVAKTLAELIRTAPRRVAVTTFASHVGRLRAVAAAARAAEREVVVVGRAMERVVQVARETGYLDGVQEFRSVESYGYLPPEKVVALCTGSQGEPRAALARIAEDEHPDIALSHGDRVIFSARPIPGNEKAIARVINGLVAGAAEIVDQLPSGRLYKDGSLLIEAEARTIAARRRLSFSGIVSVAIAINDKGALMTYPEIELIGLPESDAGGTPLLQVASRAVEETLETLPKPRRRDPDEVGESLRRAVRAAIAERWGKKPICHVHVLVV